MAIRPWRMYPQFVPTGTVETPQSLLEGAIPRDFRAERNEALHRVLRQLPSGLIKALVDGLDSADVIQPGRLFAGRQGGCAVGVTLRSLDPRLQGRRLLWGRRLKRSVSDLRRSLAIEVPHLYALEQVFDRSVQIACERNPWAPREWIGLRVATWIADEARTELALRELDDEWMDAGIAEIVSRALTPGQFLSSATSASTTRGSSSAPALAHSEATTDRCSSALSVACPA
jgi:hypothetical protein